MNNKDLIVELKNLSAGYDNTPVIKNVNLKIYQDDFIGIIGPNGSGKTTILKLILGIIKPLSGKILYHFAGKESNSFKKHIGYLPQIKNFDSKFPISVKEIVLSGLMNKKGLFSRFSKEEKTLADNLMEKLNIFHLKNRTASQLSGGQMQRVFLARALISSPRLLVLDEPNTFVDKDFENNLYHLLQELNKEIAIVLVSHDLGTISSYIKSILCVNETVHYHESNEITNEMINAYKCPIELITHGVVPHRVLKDHGNNNI